MPEHQAGIRPLARGHREAAAALFAAAHPDRADEPAGWGAPRGPAGPRRYVAVTGVAEAIVGYGGLWPVRPGKFRIDLVVAPGHRRCGIGGRRLYHRHQHGWPELAFLAVHGEEYVGFVGPLGTAVRPALRGRGIATALKVREVAAARERGVLTLDGATGNPAMLKVNERLGYRRTSTEVRLVRPL